MTTYKKEFQRSIQQPESFWAEQAKRIPWFKPANTILEPASDREALDDEA